LDCQRLAARILEIIALAGLKATFESAATNCGKSESKAAEPLWVVNAIFARLGDLPLYPIATAQQTCEIGTSVPFSASCTAINDEIGAASTW
jgi:hypothetical protein